MLTNLHVEFGNRKRLGERVQLDQLISLHEIKLKLIKEHPGLIVPYNEFRKSINYIDLMKKPSIRCLHNRLQVEM